MAPPLLEQTTLCQQREIHRAGNKMLRENKSYIEPTYYPPASPLPLLPPPQKKPKTKNYLLVKH